MSSESSVRYLIGLLRSPGMGWVPIGHREKGAKHREAEAVNPGYID